MTRKLKLSLVIATLAIGCAGYALAQGSTAHPAHEGASISFAAGDLKFSKTGVKAAAGELEAGPAYGDLQTGHHGTFIRMPKGFVSPVHKHTEDYYAVVINGVGANDPVGAKPKALPVGSYWFQRGEEAHVTRCLSKTDCLFFIVQPGKFDYLPTK